MSDDHLAVFPPVFATNRLDRGESVAGEINRMLRGLREELATAPQVSIATAYINPGGFALIATELEAASRIRLLLGAEPDPATDRAIEVSSADRDDKLDDALDNHVQWLARERDLLGFSRESMAETVRLLTWLTSVADDGTARVEVRRFTEGFLHGKAYIAEHSALPAVLAGSSNFTRAGLIRNAELNLGYPAGSGGYVGLVREWFDELWAQSEPYDLAGIYEATWEPHDPWIVFVRMLKELYADSMADEETPRTLLDLTGFQLDGVARMTRLLDSLGGVLVADEVGLGKTFLAGEVIARAASIDRQQVLIVCPAALKESMWEPFLKRFDFSRRVDVMSYDELRLRSAEENPDHERFLEELDDYALVVIDEAHNLRNPNAQRSAAVYRLVAGLNPKKVVLLTATPVNNSLMDLHTLIGYFVRDDAAFVGLGIPSIRSYIKEAQAMDPESLSPEHLFDLMDQVAVRRTRKFVKDFYPNDEITLPDGSKATIRFPTPRTHRIDYTLDDAGEALLDAMIYALTIPDGAPLVSAHADRQADPDRLILARYTPSAYLLDGDLANYQISNSGLLRSALLKRLESSPAALRRTLGTLIAGHRQFLDALDQGFVLNGTALRDWTGSEDEDLEHWVAELDIDSIDGVSRTTEYHYQDLRTDVQTDLALLERLQRKADAACAGTDPKAERLIAELRSVAEQARHIDRSGLPGSARRKVLIFSSYADTIDDISQRVSDAVKSALESDPLSDYAGRIPDAIKGQKTGIDQGQRARVLAGFAPETAGKLDSDGRPLSADEYDLLFTTDVLSEGVNLQQAGRIINYDLPWNPMRLVQRHGRIDRIGSKHTAVVLGCFFPSEHLDALLGLEEALQRKLAYADAAIGTGEVLPGFHSKFEVNLRDTREQIEQLRAENPELFENGGASAALSGEEYRRRLTQAMSDPFTAQAVDDLPWMSGSGFVNPRAPRSGYVFCIKMGEHDKPWFRFVPVEPGSWTPATEDVAVESWEGADQHLEEGTTYERRPITDDDTLTCLITADPGDPDRDRVLPDEAFEGAFQAWSIASSAALADWLKLTDPAELLPDVPKALRDAADLVAAHGGLVLTHNEQRELSNRLNSNPPERVLREVRAVMRSDLAPGAKIRAVKELVETAGLQPVTGAEPLAHLEPSDVHLIAWMAVQGRDWVEPSQT